MQNIFAFAFASDPNIRDFEADVCEADSSRDECTNTYNLLDLLFFYISPFKDAQHLSQLAVFSDSVFDGIKSRNVCFVCYFSCSLYGFLFVASLCALTNEIKDIL